MQFTKSIWNYIWAHAGKVPLRYKILGIVVSSLFILGFTIAMWVRSGLGGWLSYLLSEYRVKQAMSVGTRGVFIVTFLAILIGVLVAWFMTWILTRPISQITKVARSVQKGDLSHRVPIWANDEIGELAKTFNEMIETLERSHTKLEETNEALRRRNEELAILYDLAGAACQTQQIKIEDILNLGLLKAMEIPGADAGKIALMDLGRDTLNIIAQYNLPKNILENPAFHNPNHLFYQQVSQTRKTLVINHVDKLEGSPEVIKKHGYKIFISTPITTGENMFGVMNVLSKSEKPISQEDILFLEAIAKELGTTLEKNRIWEELIKKEASHARLLAKVVRAQEEERKRISRELHDETGQVLTTLLVLLKVCQKSSDLNNIKEKLEEMRHITAMAMNEIHRIALDLRPAALDDLGLVPAIKWFIAERIPQSDLKIQFEADALPSDFHLPSEKEVVLYRVIQEALTNVIRHAKANRVWLRIWIDDDCLLVHLKDDGIGFNYRQINQSEPDGIGLLGMRERLDLIHGEFKVDSKPNEGTEIDICVPI